LVARRFQIEVRAYDLEFSWDQEFEHLVGESVKHEVRVRLGFRVRIGFRV
jgi:hypothetical protein